MTLLRDVQITSTVLWRGVLIAVPLDVFLVSILARNIKTASFRRLKWPIAGTTALFLAAVWAVIACWLFWEPVYHHFFPAWSRWFLPIAYGLGFGIASLVSWALALHLRGSGVVNFCILVGLWGMAGHMWAVHRGLMYKSPMLRGASPEAAVVFSGFEFVFYAGVIVVVAGIIDWLRRRTFRRSRAAGAGQ